MVASSSSTAAPCRSARATLADSRNDCRAHRKDWKPDSLPVDPVDATTVWVRAYPTDAHAAGGDIVKYCRVTRSCARV